MPALFDRDAVHEASISDLQRCMPTGIHDAACRRWSTSLYCVIGLWDSVARRAQPCVGDEPLRRCFARAQPLGFYKIGGFYPVGVLHGDYLALQDSTVNTDATGSFGDPQRTGRFGCSAANV